jgi:hypothetical protein
VKRFIAFASLVALTTTAASSAAVSARHDAKMKPAAKAAHPAAVAQSCHVAPADEYFGKLKLSVLGIRNTIRDQGLQVDVDPASAPKTLNKVDFAEDALHDWEHKYPCDRWIPWTMYALEHFYGKIHTADAVNHVHRIVAWLKHDYPRVGGVIAFAVKDEAAATVSTPAPIAVAGTPAPAAAATPSPAP